MKILMTYSRIVINVLLFTFSGNISFAQNSSGNSKATLADGTSYEVTFFGNLIVGEDRTLENAMMQGRGQHLIENGMLLTSDSVVEKTNSSIKLLVNNKILTFQITPATVFCDGKKGIKYSDIKIGEMVTITTQRKGLNALSVKKGPMLFKGAGGISKLVLYKCK